MGEVPPYEGRRTEASEDQVEQMDKVFNRVDEVPPGPGREISDEEREGVGPTDTEATTPLGVGESINRRGEDVGTQGPSDRPVGVSDERASTSVDPEDTVSGGPSLPAGDQGG
jgi:hypothetical protein